MVPQKVCVSGNVGRSLEIVKVLLISLKVFLFHVNVVLRSTGNTNSGTN